MKYWTMLLMVFIVTPVQAQSRQAYEACKGINPKAAWDECLEKFDARLKELQTDPRYQAEQKRLEVEQKRLEVEQKRLEVEQRLREQEVQNQQGIAEELERLRRNQNKGFSCRASGSRLYCN
jgi:hypothetical protein